MGKVWKGKGRARGRGKPRLARAIVHRDRECTCTGCSSCYGEWGHCQRPSVQADHIIPIAEGGEDDYSNLAGKCRECHHEKSKAEAHRGLLRHHDRGKHEDEEHPGIVS